jgi:hypothetical protein
MNFRHYNHTIRWLDDKAAGLFHQPCLAQWKDNFPTFSGVIERKLGEEAYEGLPFIISGLLDLLIVKSAKLAIQDQALQRTGSKLKDMMMHGFYKNQCIQATSDAMD